MEEVEQRSHPSLPANYVSFLDLRERWMKKQHQKKEVEETEEKELEENSELHVDQEQVKPEGENKDDGDHNLLKERQSDDISVIQSNPNPEIANRRFFYSNRRHGKEVIRRWVPLKQAPAVTMIRSKQAPSIQSSEPEPAPVDLEKPKTLALYLTDLSKPPLLKISKVETAIQALAEICGSDKKVSGQKLNRMRKAKEKNQKRNRKEDLLQSQAKKGVPATNRDLEEEANAKALEEPMAMLALLAHPLKPPSSESVKVETAIQVPGEIKGSDEEIEDGKKDNGKMKKANGRNRKRYQKDNLVKSQPNKGVLAPEADLTEKDDARVQMELKALPDLHSEQSKPPPLEATKVDRTVQPQIYGSGELVTDRKLDRMMKKKKPFKKYWKRNQKAESVIQPHLKKENLTSNVVEEKEIPEQEVEADNNEVRKFTGLSETNEPEPVQSRSCGSIVARNRKGWRKGGSYEKFERKIMMKTERALGYGSLIWVKKGESSQTGDVTVENSGNVRV